MGDGSHQARKQESREQQQLRLADEVFTRQLEEAQTLRLRAKRSTGPATPLCSCSWTQAACQSLLVLVRTRWSHVPGRTATRTVPGSEGHSRPRAIPRSACTRPRRRTRHKEEASKYL